MNVALRRSMTVEEFLAWEERQELRYEFDGVGPRAMTDGTEAHSLIQANLITALTLRLRGKPCRAYGSELKVRTPTSIRYPDAFVACNRPGPTDTVCTEPVIVFEVLSRSSGDQDLFVKNGEYRATASVQQYVVVTQTHAGALSFSRKGDLWVADPLLGLESMLALPSIGVSIPLAEIYADVVLVGEAAGEDPATDS